VASAGPVTHWIGQLKAGDGQAAQPLWERYFQQLVGSVLIWHSCAWNCRPAGAKLGHYRPTGSAVTSSAPGLSRKPFSWHRLCREKIQVAGAKQILTKKYRFLELPMDTDPEMVEGSMKISSQEEYGLRCLLRLARADEAQSLTIPEIASAEGLSGPYAAKLLSVLRQAGLIESVRGRSGGYRLAGLPSDIHLGTVLMALGEPLFEEPAFCQRHAGTEAEGNCVHHGDCSLRALWHTLEHWMRRALDQLTLADLLHSGGHVTDLLRARLADAVAEPVSALITLTPLSRN